MSNLRNTKRNQAIRLAKQKGYYCDKDGNIYSREGRKRKLRMIAKMYLGFSIRTDELFGKREMTLICAHRFIAYCKYGEVIFIKGVEIRHKNGVSTDNTYDNLLIGTSSENQFDIPVNIRKARGQKAALSHRIFTDEKEREIISFYSGCRSYKLTCEKFGLKTSTLHSMKVRHNHGLEAEVDEALAS